MASRRRATRRTLTNSIGDVNRRLRYLEARPSYSSLSNHVVQRQNIQPRSVATDQIALSSITNDLIEAETVRSQELAADSVGNSELQPSSVDTENFVVGSINNAAMGEDSVSTDNIQNGSVTEDKLEDGAASNDKIADGAITEDKLADGSVTEPKIASSAVTESKINNGAVTESKISLNAVTSGKIASGAVTNAKIGSGAVTNAKIGNNAVNSSKIEDGSVTESKIANFSVSRGKLASESVSAAKLVDGAVTSAKIASSAFGVGSNNIARGNHTHPISATATNTGLATTGNLETHRHVYSRTFGTLATSSSLKVKREISDYSIDNPRRVLALRPKKYKYRNSKRNLQEELNREWMYGYIAEEVQEAGIEEILGYDVEGNVTSVNYGLLSVLLLELVREHQREIDSLKTLISNLQEKQ